jgi:hypothetical protein
VSQALQERKVAVVDRLMAIESARRGQLSEQYYKRKRADGRSEEQGPYYVWQRYVKGQKRSVRVPRDQVARVEAELQRGKEVDAIVDEMWDVLEQLAQEQDQCSKKKHKRSKQHASVRQKPPSI